MSRIDARRRAAIPFAGMLLAVLAASLPAAGALARSSDRQKPMDIEAGRQSGTLSGDSVNELSGGVHITQGTLDIAASTATITLAGGDPTRAVFRGGPVTLKQELDDGSPMSARADNVDYNLKTDVVVFTKHPPWGLTASTAPSGGNGDDHRGTSCSPGSCSGTPLHRSLLIVAHPGLPEEFRARGSVAGPVFVGCPWGCWASPNCSLLQVLRAGRTAR